MPRCLRWPRVLLVLVAGAALGVACVDRDDFVGPPRTTRLQLAPEFVQLGVAQSAPIVRVRMFARAQPGDAVLGEFDEPVDPDAPFWELDLPVAIEGEPVSILVTVEMLNAEGTVEWSGRVGPIEVVAGAAPAAVPVDVFRGPLDNLDITGVAIATSDTTLTEGDSLHAAATIEGGGAGAVLFWASLDETRAVVSASGTVTALLPTTGGPAAIVAVAGPHADTLWLGVAQRIASVRLEPDTLRFESIGAEAAIVARVVDARGDTIAGRGAVTWIVADTAVAEHLGGGVFRARALGATDVTVASVDSPLVAASARILVQQAAASVEIGAVASALHTRAATSQLSATVRDAAGNTIPGAAVAWSSLDPAVATVSGSGLVSPAGNGLARIVATSGAAADTAQVTVDLVPLTVEVTPALDTTAVSGTVPFAATARDSAGLAIPGATFTWTTGDANVATIDAGGVALGTGAGTTTISATHRGVSGTASLLVIDPSGTATCQDAALSTHSGRIVADETWTRAGSPHAMTGVFVDSGAVLTIEAGAVVCASPYTQLTVANGATLRALGSSTQPVVLSSADPAQPWYGIYLAGAPADTSRLVHALIENAGASGYGAIYTTGSHAVTVDSSRIRASIYYAAYLNTAGSALRTSVIDTVLSAGYPAVVLGNGTRFEQSIVRGAAGAGVQVVGTNVTLLGGRIEGSNGPGLLAGASNSVALGSISPRVTAGASYPAQIGIQPFGVLYSNAAAQDSLLGNAVDTVVVTGGSLYRDTVSVRPDLPWRMEGSIYFDSTSVLRVLPGATIAANPYTQLWFSNGALLRAIGTAAQPVRFARSDPAQPWYGIYLAGAPADTSRLVHALIENAGASGYGAIYTAGSHAVTVDSSRIRASIYYAAYLNTPGSALRYTVVDTVLTAGYPAVVLGTGTRFEQSTVRGAAGAGVQVAGTNVTLLGGRIEGSNGPGLLAGASNSVALGSVSPRVTGGASYPAQIGIQPFGVLYADPASQDSLLGNAVDTVAITGGSLYRDTVSVRPDLPWRMEGTIYFDSTSVLRVLPGATIAANPYTQLWFSKGALLRAIGTAAQPVRFARSDPAQPWYGIYLSGAPADTSRLVHALIENAGASGYGAIYTTGSHAVTVDSSRIRASIYYAAYLTTAGSALRTTVVDTVLTAGYPAVVVSNDVRLDGLTIRGAAGIGLDYSGQPTTPLRVNIYGAGDVAAQMTPRAVWRLGEIDDDTITGNALDRIRVVGGVVTGGTHYLRARLPWQLNGAVYVDSAATLIIEPGASVSALSGSLSFRTGGNLQAIGSAAQPIELTSSDGTNRWSGLYFYNTPSDTSRLRHVRIARVNDGGSGAIYTDASHPIQLDSSAIAQTTYRALTLNAAGSRVRGSAVDTTHQAGWAATYVSADIRLEGLTVRGAAGIGLDYAAQPTTPLRVNIYGAGDVAAQMTPRAVWRLGEVDDDTITGNALDRIRVVGGVVTGGTHYLRARLPWQLNGAVYVDSAATLIIEPGASVSALSGSISFRTGGNLQAIGSAAQPIELTSSDGTNRWSGLYFYNTPADTSRLRHVRISRVNDGGSGAIYTDASHPIQLDSSAIAQTTYRALTLNAAGSRVRGSAVDTTHQAGWAATYVSADVRLEGLTVRGAAGIGLDYAAQPTTPLRVNIYGAGDVAAQMTPRAVWRLGEIDDDTITGNALDRIRVVGGVVTGGTHYLRARLPWQLNGAVYVDSAATLIIEPGASVSALSGSLSFRTGGNLQAIGSAAQPIELTSSDGTNRWSGLYFYDMPTDTSRLRHVRVSYVNDGGNGAVYAAGSHAVALDSVVVHRPTYTGITIGTGSRVRDVTVDSAQAAGWRGIHVTGSAQLDRVRVRGGASDGIYWSGSGASTLMITSCELTGNAGHGLRVASTPGNVSITGCNIVSNGGNGVQNDAPTTATVAATGNWWGDAQGPSGANGDGISAGVDASGYTAAPFPLDFPQ